MLLSVRFNVMGAFLNAPNAPLQPVLQQESLDDQGDIKHHTAIL